MISHFFFFGKFLQLTTTKMSIPSALFLRHLFVFALLIFAALPATPAKIPLAADDAAAGASAEHSVGRETSLRGQAVINRVPVAGKRRWFDGTELIQLSDLEVISKWFIAIKYLWNLFCTESMDTWGGKATDKMCEKLIKYFPDYCLK